MIAKMRTRGRKHSSSYFPGTGKRHGLVVSEMALRGFRGAHWRLYSLDIHLSAQKMFSLSSAAGVKRSSCHRGRITSSSCHRFGILGGGWRTWRLKKTMCWMLTRDMKVTLTSKPALTFTPVWNRTPQATSLTWPTHIRGTKSTHRNDYLSFKQ